MAGWMRPYILAKAYPLQNSSRVFRVLRVVLHSEELHLMKRELLAGATVLTTLMGGQVLAQSVAVEIAPEQRTRIKEYVIQEKVRPVEVESVEVGTVLPPEIELRTVPAAWGSTVTRYRYVYAGDHVVLVEPSSRKVVRIIE
jgi:hypothetical protein